MGVSRSLTLSLSLSLSFSLSLSLSVAFSLSSAVLFFSLSLTFVLFSTRVRFRPRLELLIRHDRTQNSRFKETVRAFCTTLALVYLIDSYTNLFLYIITQ